MHIRTLRTRYTMTSSQQPLRSSWDPQDPATHQRLGVPVPDLLPVRELQPYKNWVEDGENGWSSEEEAENEDDKEQAEAGEKLQGSKEERVDAAALEKAKDVRRKTQS
ncbi:hypothetical protein AALT_g11455 [Alternaria alternata]|nr:hypothetical protein AALT_g11455 [Alternaria alternata]